MSKWYSRWSICLASRRPTHTTHRFLLMIWKKAVTFYIAELAGPKRRLVIVSYIMDDSFQDTCISGDITDDAWKELINVKIKLNSEQYLCSLEDICDTEGLKAMLDHKPEALVALSQLSGPVRMGQDLDPLPQNHIERHVISRMHAGEEFLSALADNDVFIMDEVSYYHLISVRDLRNVVMFDEVDTHLSASNALWPLYGVIKNIDLSVIQMICSKYKNICVYVLSYKDDMWEILFLHRGSAKIRPYITEQSRSLWQIVDSSSSRIIVDGKPGIGKSTFLLDIASQVKDKNPSWWILRINLVTYSDVLRSCGDSVKAHKDILLRVVYNEKNLGILEHSLLQHCLKEYAHIICLVAGSDEICPDYAEKCLPALQELAPRRGKLVVTTRPSVTGHLEAALGVLAHSLPAFSEEEVHRFHQGCNSKLGVTDVVVELLKIPLFSRMYVEALETGIRVADIVSLYETFFERKFRRLYEKWCEDLSKPGKTRMFERERKKQQNHLGFLAVSQLLPMLEVPCAAQMSSIDRDELVSAGVIYQFIDDKAVFIHRTFAEHFLATWCFSYLAKDHCAKVYQAALSDNSLEFFVESFDRMASRGRSLLTAVLNGSESEVESQLKKGADPAEKDAVGRNSLHLAAVCGRDSTLLWRLVHRLEVARAEKVGGSASGPAEVRRETLKAGVVYEMDEVSRSGEKGTTSELLHVPSDLGSTDDSGAAGLWADEKTAVATDPVTTAFEAEDDLLQWTPLRYAVERRRWRAVPALLEAGAQLRHLRDFHHGLHHPQELWTVFKENGSKALFDHILRKIDSEWSQMVQHRVEDPRSLEIKVGVSLVCAEMSVPQFYEIGTNILSHHVEVAKLLLFKIEEMQNKSASTGYPEMALNQGTRLKPHHEAGHSSSILQKLKKKLMWTSLNWRTTAHVDVMQHDNEGVPELHNAAITSDAEGVRRLIEAGADVDMQDEKGQSAIQFAANFGSVDCIKLLISAGAAVNMKDKTGSTPLLRAAGMGKRHAVRLLLDAGADALAQNCQGVSPLHWAARRGNAECVRLLVRAGKTLELKDAIGSTALHYAAFSGDVDSVKHLLTAGADCNAVDDDLRTPLHKVAGKGHTECVRQLLQAKVDVAAKTKWGVTALHCAVESGIPDCVRCLLKVSADVQEEDVDGDTPLHRAARKDSPACIALLLQEGADVQRRNRSGQTPLHCAASTGKAECVRLLLDAGADALEQDCKGVSPLHAAAWRGNAECVRLLVQTVKHLELKGEYGYTALHYAALRSDVASVKHLLAAGADSSALNDDLRTPLHLAAEEGNTNCVRLLLQAKADVAAKDKWGVTALHSAVKSNNPDCVRCLLKAGADVQEEDGDGDAPLHWAASEGSSACIRLLLMEGADLHQRNRSGQTSLHCAAFRGKAECVMLLLDAGADALAQDSEGVTPQRAAVWRGSEECVRLLDQTVKNLKLKGDYGFTALHYAAVCSDVASVKLLLAAGADTSAVDCNLRTPLHLAAKEGHTKCVRLLLQAKAYVAAKNKWGVTALHSAVVSGNPDCVRCLLKAGADVQEEDGEGDTPLHWAVRKDSPACIRLLLREGADVHQMNRSSQTPLHYAASMGKAECVRLLLAAGADALAQDRKGHTPLHAAAYRGSAECVRLLVQTVTNLELKCVCGYTALHNSVLGSDVASVKHLLAAGADTSAVDNDFRTPLHLAAEEGHTKCVRLLLQAKADVAAKDKWGVTALYSAVVSGNPDCVKCLLKAGADVQEKDEDGDTPLHWAVRKDSPTLIGLFLREGADVHQRNSSGHTPLQCAVSKGKAECVRLLLDAGADALP